MTFGKFLFFILNILVVLNYLSMAQEVSTSPVTETTATEETSTPEIDTDNIFITCDFDLENIENLLEYLPDICTEIFYNRTDDLYNLYLEESQNFAKFYKKLNDYELRNQPMGDSVELSVYPFEKELRKDIYNRVDLAICETNSSSSASDYLNCMKDKRMELINLIPNK